MWINHEALRAIREKDGHSTHSLARVSEVSQQRISELETLDDEGKPRGVRPSTAKRLAHALGVPISAITVTEPTPVERAS